MRALSWRIFIHVVEYPLTLSRVAGVRHGVFSTILVGKSDRRLGAGRDARVRKRFDAPIIQFWRRLLLAVLLGSVRIAYGSGQVSGFRDYGTALAGLLTALP
jgi:hypothetical protein